MMLDRIAALILLSFSLTVEAVDPHFEAREIPEKYLDFEVDPEIIDDWQQQVKTVSEPS